MLVVLEGLDGAGKSTQTRMLSDYLQQKSGNFTHIHFPRYNAPVYGDLISRYLRKEFGELDAVDPQLVALLYAEDRHGAAPEMKRILEGGGVILLDRYVYSNIAYQCAKIADKTRADALRQWIVDTEYGDFGLPRPDVNIFLNVPMEFVESNLKSDRQGDDDRSYLHGAKDIHESSIDFQRKVREVYLRQAELDPDYTVVDCSDGQGHMAAPEVIFSRVRAIVDRIWEQSV